MKKKPIAALVIVAIAVAFVIFFKPNQTTAPTTSDSKIYTVEELVNTLQTNPESLKGIPVQLEAYIVDGVAGVNCSDYVILADKKYVEVFKKRYDMKLTKQEQAKAIQESNTTPVLMTGRTLNMPDDLYPTYHGIYQGHFHDSWAITTCGTDGFKRFVIDKKLQELPAS